MNIFEGIGIIQYFSYVIHKTMVLQNCELVTHYLLSVCFKDHRLQEEKEKGLLFCCCNLIRLEAELRKIWVETNLPWRAAGHFFCHRKFCLFPFSGLCGVQTVLMSIGEKKCIQCGRLSYMIKPNVWYFCCIFPINPRHKWENQKFPVGKLPLSYSLNQSPGRAIRWSHKVFPPQLTGFGKTDRPDFLLTRKPLQ